MQDVLAVTKALSDESRVRALLTLREGELCLCQIIEVLGLSPSTVSRHMNLLHQAGLVSRRKNGKWQFYRLVDAPDSTPAGRALSWLVDELKSDHRARADARLVRSVRRRSLEDLGECYRSGATASSVRQR